MFIRIVHKDNMTHPIAWMNVFDDASTNKKVEGDTILEFVTDEDRLKTDYLYDKDNYKIIADGQIYGVSEITSIKESGKINKVQVEAEHYSYSLNDNIFDVYEKSGDVFVLMNEALKGTKFKFTRTDIPPSETKELKVQFTNSRYMTNRIAREFKAKVVYNNDEIGIFRSFSNATGIRLTIKKNLNGIKRIVSFREAEESVTYEIDVNESRLEALEKVDLGDALIVVDMDRSVTQVERVVIEVTKDLLTGKVTDLVLGDPNPKFNDTLLDLIAPPILEEVELMIENIEIPENVITEVIHMQVINVETAHILNAWIKNLFVEYLETNMDARLDRTSIDRYFIKAENEKYQMVYQEMDLSQVEPLRIEDPSGSGGTVQVYFTSIGSHPDAYRYFTITDPKLVHKDLTDADAQAFRVMVKKIKKQGVKYEMLFEEIILQSGAKTVVPVEWWGEGTEPGSIKGKSKHFKDDVGDTTIQFLQNNSGFLGKRMNSLSGNYEYIDPKTGKWVPEIFGYGGNGGNVIFHKDKQALTNADLSNTNALHVAYSSTGTKIVGENSTIFTSGLTVLGAEIVTKVQPIDPTKSNIYRQGVEYIPFDKYLYTVAPTASKSSCIGVKSANSLQFNITGGGGGGVSYMFFSSQKLSRIGYKTLKYISKYTDTTDVPTIFLAEKIMYEGDVVAETSDKKAWYEWSCKKVWLPRGLEVSYDLSQLPFDEFYIGIGNSTGAYPKLGVNVEVFDVWLET